MKHTYALKSTHVRVLLPGKESVCPNVSLCSQNSFIQLGFIRGTKKPHLSFFSLISFQSSDWPLGYVLEAKFGRLYLLWNYLLCPPLSQDMAECLREGSIQPIPGVSPPNPPLVVGKTVCSIGFCPTGLQLLQQLRKTSQSEDHG